MSQRSTLRRLWDNLAARTAGYYGALLTVVGVLWLYVPGAARVLLLAPAGETPAPARMNRSEHCAAGSWSATCAF